MNRQVNTQVFRTLVEKIGNVEMMVFTLDLIYDQKRDYAGSEIIVRLHRV